MDYHQDRFKDHSLMIFKGDTLIALLPANILGDVLYSHQGLTYGGLIYHHKLKFHQVLDIFASVLQYCETKRIKFLELKMLPSIYSEYPNEELSYLMFLLDAQLLRRDSLSVLNLQIPYKYSKDRRDGIKRGFKNELQIVEDDVFDDFWNTILIPNLKGKHQAKPVHTLNEIKSLKNKFPAQIKQFNVYHNNKLVAGTTIFISKLVAHSQYISGNPDKNSLGSLDFLHDYLLKNVFQNKSYFDFGISNESQGRHVNQGLQYWKEGFGARTITQDFYRVDVTNHSKLKQVLI